MALMLSTPAESQDVSREGLAYHEFRICVAQLAAKYARQYGTIGDIADAAVAGCGSRLDAMAEALDSAGMGDRKFEILRLSKANAREGALVIIAENRVKAN